MKFEKIHMRDIVAIFVLTAAFMLKVKGIDGMLDTLIALIVGYYFSKRVFEENGHKAPGS